MMMISYRSFRNNKLYALSSLSSSIHVMKDRNENNKINLAVLGTGAVGLYYGGRLLESELLNSSKINVKFIARNYYKACNDLGFSITSIDGDKVFTPYDVKKKFYNDPVSLLNSYKDNNSTVDWIIVTIKSYAINEKIKSVLDPLVSSNPNIRILLIINGYGVERLFKEWYGSERVFVSLAFTCINRILTKDSSNAITSVLIDHTAVGHLLIGHCNNNTYELEKVKQLFENSKIRVNTTESLIRSVWLKLTWNICFNGMTVALGGVTTDIIAKDEYLRSLATKIMTEIIELANDDIRDFYTSLNIDATKYFIDQNHIDIMWKYTDEMGKYKTSSALDLANNTELEIEYLFTNVWHRAIFHSKKKCNELAIKDNNKSFYPYIDHLMKMIHGINNIAQLKRKLKHLWHPTFME